MKTRINWWNFEMPVGTCTLLCLEILALAWIAGLMAMPQGATYLLTGIPIFLPLVLVWGGLVSLVYRPVRRMFSFQNPVSFRLELEHKLADRGFHLLGGSEDRLVYHCFGICRAFVPKLTLELGDRVAYVTGPRHVVIQL